VLVDTNAAFHFGPDVLRRSQQATHRQSLQKGGIITEEFIGFLFVKLDGIRTKSEGPLYFLQLRNYEEIPIVKKSEHPWEWDEELDTFLRTRVRMAGERTSIEGRIRWESYRIKYESVDEVSSDDWLSREN